MSDDNELQDWTYMFDWPNSPEALDEYLLSCEDTESAQDGHESRVSAVMTLIEETRVTVKSFIDKLRKIKRYDVGLADEGDGYMYDYADVSEDGRWVEWDDVPKVIDDFVR
jgi:hypothetical protein